MVFFCALHRCIIYIGRGHQQKVAHMAPPNIKVSGFNWSTTAIEYEEHKEYWFWLTIIVNNLWEQSLIVVPRAGTAMGSGKFWESWETIVAFMTRSYRVLDPPSPHGCTCWIRLSGVWKSQITTPGGALVAAILDFYPAILKTCWVFAHRGECYLWLSLPFALLHVI